MSKFKQPERLLPVCNMHMKVNTVDSFPLFCFFVAKGTKE